MPLLDEMAVAPGYEVGSLTPPPNPNLPAGMTMATAPTAESRPALVETLGAAFRQDNLFGSFFNRQTLGVDNEVDPTYDGWKDIAGTKYETHWESFAKANNARYAEALKRQIDMETDDRRTLDAAGIPGVVASLAAGLADPTILIPGGGVVRGAKGAYSVSRSALLGATAVGAAVAAQEAGLQSLQELRTAQESAIAIGGSVVLGGLLGGTAAALLGRAEAGKALRAHDIMSEIAGGQRRASNGADIGAAVIDKPTSDDLAVAGWLPRVIADKTKWLSPTARSYFRASSDAAHITGQLAETTLYRNENLAGRTSFAGGAAETEYKVLYQSRLGSAIDETDDIYRQMKKAGQKMSTAEFHERIGNAMRNGDVDPTSEYVTRAAQVWRSKVIEPFKEEAIALKLLPEDVSVETAASYLSRVYNKDMLIAREFEFKDRVVPWMEQKVARDYAEHQEKTTAAINALKQDIADLKLSAEDRAAQMKELEARGSILDDLNAEHVDRLSDINDLRQKRNQLAEEAKTASYQRQREIEAERRALQGEIQRIRGEGGEGLKAYEAQRRQLRRRMRNVDMGFAGVAARAERIYDQLADVDERVYRSMERLVKKGQMFEREARRWDPDTLAAKIEEMRDAFDSVATQADDIHYKAMTQAEQMRERAQKIRLDAEEAAQKYKAQAKEAKKSGDLKQPALEQKAFEARQKAATVEAEAEERVAKMLDESQRRFADRARRMEALQRRIEAAENLDPQAIMAEVREAVDLLRAQVAERALAQGEKAQRLQQRLANLDPKIVEGKIQAKEALMRRLEDGFYTRWEQQRLGQGVDLGGEPSSLPGVSGTFELRHGLGAEEFKRARGSSLQFVDNYKGRRYDDNVFGDDAVYLDNTGAWTEGRNGMWFAGAANIRFSPKNGLLVSPNTAGHIRRQLGLKDGEALTPKMLRQLADKEKRDSIIIQGFEEETPIDLASLPADQAKAAAIAAREKREAYLSRYGMDEFAAQNQVVVLDKSKLGDTGERIGGDVLASGERWKGVQFAEPAVPAPRAAAKPNFTEIARMVVDDVFDKISGRGRVGDTAAVPDYMVAASRGPMKERTFNVPDELIKDFLVSDIREVGDRYARTMAGEVSLAKRFGRPDMRDQITQIRESYKKIGETVNAAKTVEEALAIIDKSGDVGSSFRAWMAGTLKMDPDKSLKGKVEDFFKGDLDKAKERILEFLQDDLKGAVEDVEALRDLIRGTYKTAENASGVGTFVRRMNAYNYIRLSGGFLISSLNDFFHAALGNGMSEFFSGGIKPLLTNLKAVKLSAEEAKLAGLIAERALHHKMYSLAELGDPFQRGTAFDRFLANGSRLATKFNGMALFQDVNETIASLMTQNRLFKGVLNGKDEKWLSQLGLDATLRNRIADQFRVHGEVMDGAHIAHTQNWTDQQAVMAFRNAIQKYTTTLVVKPGLGDVPLFARTPLGKALLQFRSFSLSAHQRTMLRSMQEGPQQFLSGIVGTAAIGGLVAYLAAVRGGQERLDKWLKQAENPGFFLGEALDRAGMMPLLFEMANATEKASLNTGHVFNPIKTPLQAAFPGSPQGGESGRTMGRDFWSAIGGPSVGLPTELLRAAGGGIATFSGEDANKMQKRALQGLTPFGTFLGVKEVNQMLYGDSPWLR